MEKTPQYVFNALNDYNAAIANAHTQKEVDAAINVNNTRKVVIEGDDTPEKNIPCNGCSHPFYEHYGRNRYTSDQGICNVPDCNCLQWK